MSAAVRGDLLAGAREQVAALASRAAAHAPLDAPGAVAELAVAELREAGAHDQAASLAGRLPSAGLFKVFLGQQGRAGSVPFRAGGLWQPECAMGLGRPGLMACSAVRSGAEGAECNTY